jgi:putative ABC transport system substrate-binding protein
VIVSDPVGYGFVAGLPRPGGNITGFGAEEAAVGGKWLELLMEIAPGLKRVAIMFNPDTAPYVRTYYLPQFDAAARALKVAPIVAPVHTKAEIETVIMSLGREARGGLVLPGDAFQSGNLALIISLAARNNVPAVSNNIAYVRNGGLLSYGEDLVDIYRQAAPYVDRILHGEKPADLPAQLATKFEMGLNTKTAKALGLKVPTSILLRANEVIE